MWQGYWLDIPVIDHEPLVACSTPSLPLLSLHQMTGDPDLDLKPRSYIDAVTTGPFFLSVKRKSLGG